jgi:hypothetical protein
LLTIDVLVHLKPIDVIVSTTQCMYILHVWSSCNGEHSSISMDDMPNCKRSIEMIIIEQLNHCNRLFERLQLHAENHWNCISHFGSVVIEHWNHCTSTWNDVQIYSSKQLLLQAPIHWMKLQTKHTSQSRMVDILVSHSWVGDHHPRWWTTFVCVCVSITWTSSTEPGASTRPS